MDVQFLNAQAVNKEKFKVELIKKLEQVKENKQVISLNWHCMPMIGICKPMKRF